MYLIYALKCDIILSYFLNKGCDEKRVGRAKESREPMVVQIGLE